MKLSLNWIKQFTAVEISVEELVAKIGAQLGEVEAVEQLGPKYDKAVVVKVISCEKHPNADRLKVCTIDDGAITPGVKRDENGHVQVVCGAPNVTAGVSVVWLPPGATVPDSFGKEPFVLEARELRGVVSNGMLASPKELGIGDSHEGLLLITDDTPTGTHFATAYDLDDYIIDIENKMFTHRPDLFGELGLAREVAGITGHKFTSPSWYTSPEQTVQSPAAETLPLEVRNELPALVPRFMALALGNVQIRPSPMSMQTTLARVGIRPINNVVDITNYMMVLTGQPLHAYDYDKVKALSSGDAAVLGVRNPHEAETLTLLSGKTIEPRPEAIMIATDRQPIGLGGVMGGADTEIDDSTTNIILEVASFDMYSIRRTSMAHGLFTDAVSRFNKGQSPLQNPAILHESVRLLAQLAGAQPASQLIDDNHTEGRTTVHPPVPVDAAFINARLGLTLAATDMKALLENVEFDIALVADKLVVTAPFWRTDIETREDVVEEVGRLYGFDRLPLELPRRSIKPAPRNTTLQQKKSIRENLATNGANELLTYSFVHGNLLDKVGQDKTKAFKLSNALSPDLQYYRLSLTPSLLDKVHANIKAGYDEFALFELGKVHYDGEWDAAEPTLPNEDNHLALIVAASDRSGQQGSAYYLAERYLERLDSQLPSRLVPMTGYDLNNDEWGAQLTAPYEPARSALIIRDDQIWGVVGEFRPAVQRALKLPRQSAGFEVHLDVLSDAAPAYQPLPRFPKVIQDMTLETDQTVSYVQVERALQEAIRDLKPAETLVQLEPVAIYQKPDDREHRRLSFRISIASYEKTMTDNEANSLLDAVSSRLHDNLGTTRR